MVKSLFVAGSALLAALLAEPVIADNDFVAKLAACQAIASEGDRLACYDELAESTLPIAEPVAPVPEPAAAEPAPVAAPPAPVAATAAAIPAAETAPASTPAPQPLTDEVAKQEIKGTDIERPEYSAVVTRCEELKQQKRMFFIMENGQVWRQSNAGRLRFKAKDCQFEATIKKDMFGWILHIPSENERVRVKRVR